MTHGSPAKQAVLFLYLEAGPAMASPELGNSEAKVPSFLSQRASFLADVHPGPGEKVQSTPSSVPGEKYTFKIVPSHALRRAMEPQLLLFLFLASQVLSGCSAVA